MPPAVRSASAPAAPHFRRERALMREIDGPVAGIDEVGRGPLAGPVVAAAVILDPGRLPRGVFDSKAMSAQEREAAYEAIAERALAIGVGFSPAVEIDRINIRQATFAAMRRALRALATPAVHVLIDGSDCPPALPCAAQTIVKGDAVCLSIAAASVVAKVTRDRLMRRYDGHYPLYGFSAHVGYATARHLAALRDHGPCPLHRMSFSPLRPAEEQLALV